jgi:hypothetical protein
MTYLDNYTTTLKAKAAALCCIHMALKILTCGPEIDVPAPATQVAQ